MSTFIIFIAQSVNGIYTENKNLGISLEKKYDIENGKVQSKRTISEVIENLKKIRETIHKKTSSSNKMLIFLTMLYILGDITSKNKCDLVYGIGFMSIILGNVIYRKYKLQKHSRFLNTKIKELYEKSEDQKVLSK